MLSVLHSQHHACWCSGDFRNQGISSHGIDPQSQNIPSPASGELKCKYMSMLLQKILDIKSLTSTLGPAKVNVPSVRKTGVACDSFQMLILVPQHLVCLLNDVISEHVHLKSKKCWTKKSYICCCTWWWTGTVRLGWGMSGAASLRSFSFLLPGTDVPSIKWPISFHLAFLLVQ